MTEDKMLEVIQERYRSQGLLLSNGITAAIQVETLQVPLVVLEDGGEWFLKRVGECWPGMWGLTYMYRVPVYFVKTIVPGNQWVEMNDTQTSNYQTALESATALNLAADVRDNERFRVGVLG